MERKKIKEIEIHVRKTLNSDFFGAYNTHFLWNGLEFSDLREYVPGDSVKRIDWKTTARQNDVFVKNFEQERDLKVFFFLDVSSTMHFWSRNKTKFQTLVELLYTLWFAAVKSGDTVWAYIYNWNVQRFIDFGKWEETLQKIAYACHEMQQVSQSDIWENIFETHIKNLQKLKIKDALVCICSDTLNISSKVFKGLNARNELLYCNIFDSFENVLCEENIAFSFSQWKKSFWWFFSSQEKSRTYRSLRQNKIQTLSRDLLSSRIDYLCFDESTHIYIAFLKYFKQAHRWK